MVSAYSINTVDTGYRTFAGRYGNGMSLFLCVTVGKTDAVNGF